MPVLCIGLQGVACCKVVGHCIFHQPMGIHACLSCFPRHVYTAPCEQTPMVRRAAPEQQPPWSIFGPCAGADLAAHVGSVILPRPTCPQLALALMVLSCSRFCCSSTPRSAACTHGCVIRQSDSLCPPCPIAQVQHHRAGRGHTNERLGGGRGQRRHPRRGQQAVQHDGKSG